MNRRNFSAFSMAALAAPNLAFGKGSGGRPTPDALADALPSALPGPGRCASLPERPAPWTDGLRRRLLPGFSWQDIATDGATIHVAVGGKGPPLLLLHGHPETHVTWHKIAPALAERFTVILPDLRGYGDSSKPDYSQDHVACSFRAMAQDMVTVMAQLGHRRFAVAGHDRGGRVAHRLCLDHPEAVSKVALLDIAPTLTMYDGTDKAFATKYVWWFLQIQPAPMPEHLIALDPAYYLRDHLFVQNKTPGSVTPDAMAEYMRCYCCSGTIRAACEDYRAAAGIDLEMDRADDRAGNRIRVPVLALWGAEGTVGRMWDVLATWRSKASGPVTGTALPCGHLLPEEQPEMVLERFRSFFG